MRKEYYIVVGKRNPNGETMVSQIFENKEAAEKMEIKMRFKCSWICIYMRYIEE